MKIALVQQHTTSDKSENVARGLRAFEAAARAGAALVCFAELAFEPFYPQKPAEPRSLDAAEPVPGPLTDAFAAKGIAHAFRPARRESANACSAGLQACPGRSSAIGASLFFTLIWARPGRRGADRMGASRIVRRGTL